MGLERGKGCSLHLHRGPSPLSAENDAELDTAAYQRSSRHCMCGQAIRGTINTRRGNEDTANPAPPPTTTLHLHSHSPLSNCRPPKPPSSTTLRIPPPILPRRRRTQPQLQRAALAPASIATTSPDSHRLRLTLIGAKEITTGRQ